MRIPLGLEVRVVGQGAQGGGGGAGYSRGGPDGEGGGRIVPGHPGSMGEYFETKWMKGGTMLTVTVGVGGEGGRGVEGLHGGKGADGWMRVEIRRIGLRARLRYVCSWLLGQVSLRLTWEKAGVIVGAVAALAAVIAVVIAATSG